MNGSGGDAHPGSTGTVRSRQGTGGVSRRAVAVAAAATAVVAFVIGFGLAVLDRDTETRTVAAPPSTRASEVPTTAASPSTTIAVEPPPTVERPTSTTRPPAAPGPSTPTTARATPPTTAPSSPARLDVTSTRDGQGRLVVPAGGIATITITNAGGALGQYLVQASGFVFVEGPASGSLAPGDTATVSIRAAPEPPRDGTPSSVTVTAAGGTSVTIPVLIASA